MLKGILMVTFGYLGKYLLKVLFCKEGDVNMGGSGLIGMAAVGWLIMLVVSIVGLFSGNENELTNNLIMLGISLAVAAVVFVFSRKAHLKAAEQNNREETPQ